jgi:glycosyltransferase involved in cell wall biosynthesis
MNSAATKVIGSRSLSAPRPKVSVAMITYQHKKFVTQAVESVLMQRTNFPYELVIGEDCSTDGTQDIVLELQRKHPDRIKALLPTKNLGMMANSFQTLLACDGDYVARLEGDDYWTDPCKLQRQVDLLESKPQLSACFTRTQVIGEEEMEVRSFIPGENAGKEVYTIEDMLAKNCIATASIMYRNAFREIDLDSLLESGLDDWPVHILFSHRGPIGYISEVMAAYRLHGGGIWTAVDEVVKLEAIIQMYKVVLRLLPPQFAPQIIRKIVKTHQLAALELLRKGDKRSSRLCTLKSIRSIPLTRLFDFRWYLKRSAVLLLGSFNLPLPKVESLLRT